MQVAPSRETSRTATVVLGGCRSASVTSGASSLGAHAGGNRKRGGGAGGSVTIIAESQVAYGTGCRAVYDGCGSCRAPARLQCAQTPHAKQTQHADGTRGHLSDRSKHYHMRVRASCIPFSLRRRSQRVQWPARCFVLCRSEKLPRRIKSGGSVIITSKAV